MMPAVLRAIAISIAIAALVDPVWSVSRQPDQELVVVDLTAGGTTGTRPAIQGWRAIERRADGHRLPCAPDEHCVVIADGSRDIDVPGDRDVPLSMLLVRDHSAPNITLRAVSAPAAHLAASGSLRAELTRAGAIASTELRVLDGDAIVGSAIHTWGDETAATIEVPWWPLQAGARRLRVEAVPAAGETATMDNVIDVGVAVGDTRMPVLVFDARPSWSSTFVRRSLEDDPRFAVSYRARLAPSLSAGTRGGVLDAATLESVPVVIAGGLDALTATDVALLDRFVTTRGGTLILLPEHRVLGPASRFFSGSWTEHLVPAPERIGPLHATEILRSPDLPATASVIGRSGDAASIAALPSGAGRTVIAGAMDAWRHRLLDPPATSLRTGPSTSLRTGPSTSLRTSPSTSLRTSGAFDRFWRSTVAQGAMQGAGLRLDMGSSIAATGTRVPFTLRHYSLESRTAIEAAVTAVCGDAAAVPVRVWPAGPSGEFNGELIVEGTSQCRVTAAAGDRAAAASVAVANRVTTGVSAALTKLERAVTASGGIVADDEAALARALNAVPPPTSRIVSVRPLRSAWWIMPFALCLSGEWWMRRRAGLR